MEDREQVIFVCIPKQPDRFVRTHPCVAYRDCKGCGSKAGEPCQSGGRYTGIVCYGRLETTGWNSASASEPAPPKARQAWTDYLTLTTLADSIDRIIGRLATLEVKARSGDHPGKTDGRQECDTVGCTEPICPNETCDGIHCEKDQRKKVRRSGCKHPIAGVERKKGSRSRGTCSACSRSVRRVKGRWRIDKAPTTEKKGS